MADTPDFKMEDLEEMIDFLNPYIENHAEGSKERTGFTFAQIALLYIRDKVKKEDFEEYRKKFLPGYWPKFDIVQEFATREEADQWRASGKAKDRDRVKIAGKGHMVVEVNGKPFFIVVPLPEELNSPEWQDDSEDDSE
ncbi:hypothetical protein [Archangium sp.]|uniref:hypothetical protein n=1 Tax=Archangium sp. TaxID=1872627 RepID=UPI00286D5432|nr:hypothetical protein [Archangium sp.]